MKFHCYFPLYLLPALRSVKVCKLKKSLYSVAFFKTRESMQAKESLLYVVSTAINSLFRPYK